MQFEANFVTKVGKILSRQRIPDRYTLVSIFKPKEKQEKDHGILYFVIEILSADPAMKKVAQLIEETVIEEYYKDLTDGLDSLEAAIKKVNENLADLADEGEVSWIGKINGVIAALEQNILHITQTGTCEAYLVRENKITHITENLSSAAEKPNPLKTFINIASGELNIGDRIIISTSELFYHFSLDDLRRIVSKFSPAISAAYIVKILRREEIESINTLILELTTEEELKEESSLPPETEEKEKISEELYPLQQYITKLLPFWKLFLTASSKGIERSKEIYKEKISPTITKLGQEASEKVAKKVTEISKKEKEEKTEESQRKAGPSWTEKSPQQDLFEVPKRKAFTLAFKTVKISYSKARDFISKSRKRSQFFMIAAILLIMLLIISGFYSFQKKKMLVRRTKIEQTYEAIKTKTEGAIKAQKLGDEKKARSLLSEAKKEIKTITASIYLHDEIMTLSKQINSAIEDIFNIQKLDNLTPLVNFNQLDKTIKLGGIYKAGNKIISFDQERHNVALYSLETQELASDISISYDGKIIDLTPLTDRNTISLLAVNPYGIYTYNVSLNFIEKNRIVTGEDWPEATSISSYFNNLYLLVPNDNQIYKYALLANGYSNKTNYINDNSNVDLSNAIDIAIDGSIYILKKDGCVLQYLAGNLVDFEISGIPPQEFDTADAEEGKLLSPTKIITNADIDEIYILDPGARRIVVFDKLGDYVTQYISNKFTDLKDFWVDWENKKIYVLSGSEVYEIAL